MAPIHHHFEVGGWPEFTVIVRFWLFAGVCVALALGLFYADFINIPGVDRLMRVLVVGLGATGDAVVRYAHVRAATRSPSSTTGTSTQRAEYAPASSRRRRSGPRSIVAAGRGDRRAPRRGRRPRRAEPGRARAPPRDPGRARGAGVPVRSEIDLAAALASPGEPPPATRGARRRHRNQRQDDRHDADDRDARGVGRAGRRRRQHRPARCSTPSADDVDVVVAEVSSFQLAFTTGAFRPRVAALLNLAEDHLDWHRTFDAYARAEGPGLRAPEPPSTSSSSTPTIPSSPGSPPVRRVGGCRSRCAPGAAAGFRLVDAAAGRLLVAADGTELVADDALAHRAPHDLANALAAAALALELGPSRRRRPRRPVARSPVSPHRLQLVGEHAGVRYFDDSKATNVHATLAGVRGFPSVVLVAGGQNKGLDLSALAPGGAESLRAVGRHRRRRRRGRRRAAGATCPSWSRRRCATRCAQAAALPSPATSCSCHPRARPSTGTTGTPRVATTSRVRSSALTEVSR